MGLGTPIHYRGYQLSQDRHLGWSVKLLASKARNSGMADGFSTPPRSLADAKALIDWPLDQAA